MMVRQVWYLRPSILEKGQVVWPMSKQLTFDAATHTYRHGGVVVPSVTQILNTVGTRPLVKGEYGYWTPLSGYDFSGPDTTATRFGRALHEYIRCILQGVAIESFDPQLQPWIVQWERYMRDNGGMLLAFAERAMYCRYGYAMTPDALFTTGEARTSAEWILHDWKSGESTTTVYWELQMAAYAQGIREQMGLKLWPTARIVQVTDHNYAVHVIPPRTLETRFNTFLSALNVYTTFARRKEKAA